MGIAAVLWRELELLAGMTEPLADDAAGCPATLEALISKVVPSREVRFANLLRVVRLIAMLIKALDVEADLAAHRVYWVTNLTPGDIGLT